MAGGAGEAAAKWGLAGWMQACHEASKPWRASRGQQGNPMHNFLWRCQCLPAHALIAPRLTLSSSAHVCHRRTCLLALPTNASPESGLPACLPIPRAWPRWASARGSSGCVASGRSTCRRRQRPSSSPSASRLPARPRPSPWGQPPGGTTALRGRAAWVACQGQSCCQRRGGSRRQRRERCRGRMAGSSLQRGRAWWQASGLAEEAEPAVDLQVAYA